MLGYNYIINIYIIELKDTYNSKYIISHVNYVIKYKNVRCYKLNLKNNGRLWIIFVLSFKNGTL